jgi:hypothetical protein
MPSAPLRQINLYTGLPEVEPEQLSLGLPPPPDCYAEDPKTVSLLTTEGGGQLYVAGFGLSLGKKKTGWWCGRSGRLSRMCRCSRCRK